MLIHSINKIVIACLVILVLPGCAKEYSREAGPPPTDDTIMIPAPVAFIPGCRLCNDQSGINFSSWRFETGTSVLCGRIDTAVVSPARTAFTFFGPSTCSLDSGMVISGYLVNDTLNRDLSNFTIDRVAFYYYDRITPSDILVSRQNSPFTIVIDHYSHQTKIATGTFSGNVFRTNGGGARVTNGRFHVRLL